MCLELLACVIGSNVELNKHSHQITRETETVGVRERKVQKSLNFLFFSFISSLGVSLSRKAQTEGKLLTKNKRSVIMRPFIYMLAKWQAMRWRVCGRGENLINRLAWSSFSPFGRRRCCYCWCFCCGHKQITVIFQSFQIILMAMCQVGEVKVSSPFLYRV